MDSLGVIGFPVDGKEDVDVAREIIRCLIETGALSIPWSYQHTSNLNHKLSPLSHTQDQRSLTCSLLGISGH